VDYFEGNIAQMSIILYFSGNKVIPGTSEAATYIEVGATSIALNYCINTFKLADKSQVDQTKFEREKCINLLIPCC
jgi:hypothetical protein